MDCFLSNVTKKTIFIKKKAIKTLLFFFDFLYTMDMKFGKSELKRKKCPKGS